MEHHESLWKQLDLGIWEMGEAFKGFPAADLWKRPAPGLLSVGEVACHVVYWEAMTFLGEGYESALVTAAARYYTSNVNQAFSLELGPDEVYAEVQRVHEACKHAFFAARPDLAEPNPHREGWKWGDLVEYQAFHIAYHTGQIYSARHLMGHQTVDN